MRYNTYYTTTTLGGYSDQKYDFTGKERDTETGLHYFGARYYDSELGVWLQVAPLADKYPGWSPYNYCVNNPVRMVDPDGRRYVDANGKQITYKISNGSITFSKNATADFKRIATALAGTETGLKQLNKGRNLTQNIEMNLNSGANIKKNSYGETTITFGTAEHYPNYAKTGADGKTEYGTLKTTITINEGSITDPRATKHDGLTTEQAIGAVAGHELEHAAQAGTEVKFDNLKLYYDSEKKPNDIEEKIIEESKRK